MNHLFNPVEDFRNSEEIILRDYLALERTRLANERTLFSYIRTSLYLLTVGIGMLQIDSIQHLWVLAWICIFVSTGLAGIGFIRYHQLKQHLKKYYTTEKSLQP